MKRRVKICYYQNSMDVYLVLLPLETQVFIAISVTVFPFFATLMLSIQNWLKVSFIQPIYFSAFGIFLKHFSKKFSLLLINVACFCCGYILDFEHDFHDIFFINFCMGCSDKTKGKLEQCNIVADIIG